MVEALRIAFRALRANRLRSVLTMLGIIIGVGAVILLAAIGAGVKASVDKKVQPLTNLITVVPSAGSAPGGSPPKDLIDADVSALRKASGINAALPIVTGGILAETDTVKFRSHVLASTERWLEISNQTLQAGSFFTEDQVRSTAKVLVIGPTAAKTLFGGNQAALHQTIRINRRTFQVIGVLKSVGEPGDSNMITPLNTGRRYLFGGGNKVNQIILQATHSSAVPSVAEEVIAILTDRHRIKDPTNKDFEVQSLLTQLDTFNQVLRILTLFTVSVASISLLVGSIGVLNIMLVSVTERTREIGIRKAIGATRRAILQQFLIEAIVLAGLGGLIGILTGIGLAKLGAMIAPTLGPDMDTFAPTVTVLPVLLSFGISLIIGLVSGCYPAVRAARLQPVEALRYE